MSNTKAGAAVENFWREVWQPPQNPKDTGASSATVAIDSGFRPRDRQRRVLPIDQFGSWPGSLARRLLFHAREEQRGELDSQYMSAAGHQHVF
jgi:hypothetical protein